MDPSQPQDDDGDGDRWLYIHTILLSQSLWYSISPSDAPSAGGNWHGAVRGRDGTGCGWLTRVPADTIVEATVTTQPIGYTAPLQPLAPSPPRWLTYPGSMPLAGQPVALGPRTNFRQTSTATLHRIELIRSEDFSLIAIILAMLRRADPSFLPHGWTLVEWRAAGRDEIVETEIQICKQDRAVSCEVMDRWEGHYASPS